VLDVKICDANTKLFIAIVIKKALSVLNQQHLMLVTVDSNTNTILRLELKIIIEEVFGVIVVYSTAVTLVFFICLCNFANTLF